MKQRTVLGLIGCGKMAYALVSGLIKSGHGFESIIGFDVDESRKELFVKEFAVQAVGSNQEVASQADVVVLAVKPNYVNLVLDEIRNDLATDTLLVSIAAGIPTSFIEQRTGEKPAVIRVMPNTPCLIGEGASAVARGRFVTPEDEELVLRMFSSLGKALTVPESYMDAVTALSGSGPAYIYLVAEAMVDAGVEIGLPREIARSLVVQTMKGAVAMMEASGEHPAVLKDQVTSPGGTTIAGVCELEEHGLRKAFFRAVRRAYERSMELGKG